MRVVLRDEKLIALDNRRLYAFQKALSADTLIPMKVLVSESAPLTQGLLPVSKCQRTVRVEKTGSLELTRQKGDSALPWFQSWTGHGQASSGTSEYKIVSLGCCCAVNLTLLNMSLRQEAYPFDNIRICIEGVLHFLETRFADFIPYCSTDGRQSKVPYQGEYHSFWHDNLDALEDQAKYKRRIDRFLALSSLEKKLLFVFACNSSFEVAKGERLLGSLCDLFWDSKVWLLLLVDGQYENRLIEVESTNGRLLVHCMAWHDCEDQGSLFMCGVREGISCFIEHVQAPSPPDVIQSSASLEPRLVPYTGGDARREKYKMRKCGCRLASTQGRDTLA